MPARWIFGDKAPADGSAICEKLFDREYVKNLKDEVDKKEMPECEAMDDNEVQEKGKALFSKDKIML